MNSKIRHYIYCALAIAALYPCSAHATGWVFTSVKSSFNGLPGATGNGTTDDTAAINRAIAAGTGPLFAAAIYFPPGIYLYTGPMKLVANTSYRLYGDGPGVSTILFAGPNRDAGINVTHTGIATLNVEGLTLMANTINCGTAINASFMSNNTKFHTATIHNVQIIGSARDGTNGGYWITGIHLYRAQNSVIDKVDISGNKNVTQTGITWNSSTTETITGLQLSNLEIKWCNTALLTNGSVQGLYMTGFEFISCGRSGLPAVGLNASPSGGAIHLVNGHVDSVGSGVTLTDQILIKISNVSFTHTGTEVSDSTMLAISNPNTTAFDAIVSECSFYGVAPPNAVANEDGIFLTDSHSVRIAGNNFSHMQPVNGSCIVIYGTSSVVRITDNLFSNVRNRYYDGASDTYYLGNN